jgi:hypothetical protein
MLINGCGLFRCINTMKFSVRVTVFRDENGKVYFPTKNQECQRLDCDVRRLASWLDTGTGFCMSLLVFRNTQQLIWTRAHPLPRCCHFDPH